MTEYVSHEVFMERYKRWKQDCRREFKEMGYKFHWKHYDIWESGAIYFKYDGYLTEANFVTSWRESKWYCE